MGPFISVRRFIIVRRAFELAINQFCASVGKAYHVKLRHGQQVCTWFIMKIFLGWVLFSDAFIRGRQAFALAINNFCGSVATLVKPDMQNCEMVSKSARCKTGTALSVDWLVGRFTILKINSFEQIYWFILLLLLQGGHKRSPHGAIWPGMHPVQPSWAVSTADLKRGQQLVVRV